MLTEDPSGGYDTDPQCVHAARATADTLAGLGHDVSDGFLAALRQEPWPAAFGAALAVVVKRELDRLGTATPQ